MLVLDMIEILPPLEKYKYDTWRILPVKCYINNFVRLQSCIRNVNTPHPMDSDLLENSHLVVILLGLNDIHELSRPLPMTQNL
jgi:hypothetical protein